MIISRPTSENKLKHILNANIYNFLCLLIVLISVFIRSLADIGSDTGVYLDVGRKLALGKKYYHDIFEINFPIMMWFYALQYKLSSYMAINPIIMAEITVNILAILSIIWSLNILQKTQYYQDKILYNVLKISFFLSFFLRPYGLFIFEFGTKASYFLILFYPYLSIFLRDYNDLKTKDLIYKAILIALIASLKPHYVLFFLIVELYPYLKYKKLSILIGIDKLIAVALYVLYFLIILKFNPEFIEYVAPMWSNYFKIYTSLAGFFKEFLINLTYVIFPILFILLVYSRYQPQEIDKKLILILIGSTGVFLLEKIYTIDQYSLFCSINSILVARVLLIILRNKFFKFSQNLFFLGFFIFIPLFDKYFLNTAIFGINGVINIWWVIIIYNLIIIYKSAQNKNIQTNEILKKLLTPKKILIYAFVYITAILITIFLTKVNLWYSNLASMFFCLSFFYIFERKFQTKFCEQMSRFSIFIIMASIFVMIHNYTYNFNNIMSQDGYRSYSRQLSDFKAYYHKIFAQKNGDNELNFNDLHQLAYPFLSYQNKESVSVISIYSLNANSSFRGMIFPIRDAQTNFVNDYIFRDLKKNLFNSNTKLIFFDMRRIDSITQNKCTIGYLEYLFLDKEIKDYFLKNFKYENRLIFTKNYQENPNIFDKIFIKFNPKSTEKFSKIQYYKIQSETEVYVRKN